MTRSGTAAPSCPVDRRWHGGARGGTASSPSSALLDVAHGYAEVVPSWTGGCGVPNQACPTSSTPF